MKKLLSGTALFLALLPFVAAPPPAFGQVNLTLQGGDHVAIEINGQPYADFFIGSSFPKPFLAPLRSAGGQIVTRKYPMEKIEGESRDHQHQRGLFFGYGDVNGVDFWANELDYTTDNRGRIVTRHVEDLKSGKKSGSVTASFEWQDSGGAPILEERRSMTFYAEPDRRVIDVDSTLTAKINIRFNDTKEGFFAIRLADSMTEAKGGLITSSEGRQTEKNVWGRQANWVDYDGVVDGQKMGVVVFDHPANPGHPPRWHVRGYGLLAVNPFAQKEFDKSAPAGGMALNAGSAIRFRYRVVIHQGDLPMKKLTEWHAEYARKVK